MVDKIRIGKVLLVVFNVIYAILAICMVAIGVYFARKHYTLIQKLRKYDKVTAKLIINLDYAITGDDLLCIVVLVAGSAAILLIIFNLFSIYTKNIQKLRILGLTLTMLCAIKLTIGILFLITAQYPVEVKSHLQRNFNRYTKNTKCETAQTFIEEEHDCCGIVNYTDYVHLNMSQYPNSCYEIISEREEKLRRSGCAKRIKDYYMARIMDIGLVCLLVGSLEVFGPISTFYLANAMKGPMNTATAV